MLFRKIFLTICVLFLSGSLLHAMQEPLKTYNDKEFLELILKDPLSALTHITKIEVSAVTKFIEDDDTDDDEDFKYPLTQERLEKYSAVTETFQNYCSIFWLGKCKEEDYEPRAPSAFSYRQCYEQKVVTALLQKLTTHESDVHYLSIGGSDVWFHTLSIVAHTLNQKKDAHLTIHIITPQVKPLDDEKDKPLIELRQKTKRSQFLNFLTKSFPEATLHLQVYGSAEEYCENIKSLESPDAVETGEKTGRPDIITTKYKENSLNTYTTGKLILFLLWQTKNNITPTSEIFIFMQEPSVNSFMVLSTNKNQLPEEHLDPEQAEIRTVCDGKQIESPFYCHRLTLLEEQNEPEYEVLEIV